VIEPQALWLWNEDEGNGERDKDKVGKAQARIVALKHHILVIKPNFFEHLLTFHDDKDEDMDMDVITTKSELLAEILQDFPQAKTAVVPFIEQLLLSLFQEDADNSGARRAWNSIARCPIAALLCPDSKAHGANKAVVKALSAKIKSFPQILSTKLKAGDMNDALIRKQKALAYGLLNITDTPLDAAAVPSFIRSDGLDALLAVITRGPLSPLGAEVSRNESLEDACNALSHLMDTSTSEDLGEALIARQAVAPLIKQMTYICELEDVFSSEDVLRSLMDLAKYHNAILKEVLSEAQNMISLNPKGLGPGAPIVLWLLLEYAPENEIEKRISTSKNYVPYFLNKSKPGTSGKILNAVGEALALRIGEPGRQLRKGISTPEDVEKFVHLLEYASTQSTPEISPTAQVLRELVLPSGDKDNEGFSGPEADLKRVNKQFCNLFSKALKTRWDAALALAFKVSVNEGNGRAVTEPSEDLEGLAHLKNGMMLSMVAGEQYIIMALLANGLLDYLKAMIFSPSPLSRRVGLEVLSAMTKDSSWSGDFPYVPEIIDAFKEPVANMLHTEQYQIGIDFVMQSVTEAKLLEMLRGTVDEAKVAADMIESMARHAIGSKTQTRLKKNQALVEALWNGVFWDADNVSAVQLVCLNITNISIFRPPKVKTKTFSTVNLSIEISSTQAGAPCQSSSTPLPIVTASPSTSLLTWLA
jgi:hypothetical protein